MGSKRVELFAAIRFDWQRNGMSIRSLARKYDVHRRTVRQAIASPLPPDRKVAVRVAPVRAAVVGWIDEMLREDLAAPRKQRHTAKRVFERLRDEHDAQVSYSTVAKYVHRRRAEIIAAQVRAEAAGVAGFVPQAKEPGAEAEVDFADVFVEVAGRLARCYLFDFRLSCSGKGCHRPIDRTTGVSSPVLVIAAESFVPDATPRTEPPWMSTRRFPSETWQGWWSPKPGQCGRQTIPCCRGSWWTGPASRSSPSATSCGTCWPAATARPHAGLTPMTCCDGFGSWQRLTSGGTGRSAPRYAISCCGCARATIRPGAGGARTRRRRDR